MAKQQQQHSCGFGGSSSGAGLHKGALVAREMRCELSFCTMPLPSILKRAGSYILGESCQDSLRAMYQVRLFLMIFFMHTHIVEEISI